jgi:hypothetical protein
LGGELIRHKLSACDARGILFISWYRSCCTPGKQIRCIHCSHAGLMSDSHMYSRVAIMTQ